MSDLLYIYLTIAIVLAGVCLVMVIGGAVAYSDTNNHNHNVKEDIRKEMRKALVVLAVSPFWPLALCYVVFMVARKVYLIATGKI